MTNTVAEGAWVVTTAHQGVFFGYSAEPGEGPIVTLARARMCIHWPNEMRGVLGLASQGPVKGSRVTPAVPSLTLRDVTAIMLCTLEAAAQWEREPWA